MRADPSPRATVSDDLSWRIMRVSVDYELCTSIGTCTRICPEVFEVRRDGLLYVLQDEPPESLRASVEEAVDMCPMAAITIAD